MNRVDYKMSESYVPQAEVDARASPLKPATRVLGHAVNTPCTPLNERQWELAIEPVDRPKALTARDGELWECTKLQADPLGGHICTYRMKDIYNDLTPGQDLMGRRKALSEKIDEMYPAVEPVPFSLLYLDPEIDEEKLLKIIKLSQIPAESHADVVSEMLSLRVFAPLLWDLGYSFRYTADGIYISVPDREALLARWEKLRERYPDLPPLNIQSSEGIAGHLDFIKAFFIYDAVLSTGKEFLHDHFYHVIAVIMLIAKSSTTYRQEKSRMVQVMGKCFRRIQIAKLVLEQRVVDIPEEKSLLLTKHLPKIEAALGAKVDLASASLNYKQTQTRANADNFNSTNFFMRIWDDKVLQNYWDKNFGLENIKREKSEIRAAFEMLGKLEQQFDALPILQ